MCFCNVLLLSWKCYHVHDIYAAFHQSQVQFLVCDWLLCRQINTAKGILDEILNIQPKESGGGKPGETREAIVYKLADDMLRYDDDESGGMGIISL